jgi:putative membrane protein
LEFNEVPFFAKKWFQNHAIGGQASDHVRVSRYIVYRFWLRANSAGSLRRIAMNGIVLRWFGLTVAIVAAAYLLNGIQISGFFSALFAAAMLGILNAVLRPIALILTLPINVLTLGLFTFVINALMLKMASGLIPGFDVQGFWTAIFGSLIISIISWLLNSFISDQGSVTYINVKHGRDNPKIVDGHGSNDTNDTIDLKHKGDDKWE